MAFRFPQIILFLLAAMLFCPGSYAEQKPTAAQEARKTAVEVAVEGMSRAAVAGPTKISLGDKATLNLPEGFTWIPAKKRRYLCVKLVTMLTMNIFTASYLKRK